MNKFTPGPWIFGNTSEDRRIILGGRGEYVCVVQIYQTPRNAGMYCEDEREANARLIAAAPTMYAFIEREANVGNAGAIKIMEAIDGRA